MRFNIFVHNNIKIKIRKYESLILIKSDKIIIKIGSRDNNFKMLFFAKRFVESIIRDDMLIYKMPSNSKIFRASNTGILKPNIVVPVNRIIL